MKIVVTGAYGQLGGELCRQLGQDAVPLDIDTLDLRDRESVLRMLPELRPHAVINCAAYTRVDQAEREPAVCRAVNATAVRHLAEACRALDCPLVQISTDYVFGDRPDRTTPYAEDQPASPQSVYAKTKLEGEQAAAGWARHLIVRTCGLYARPTDPRARNFVKTMLRWGARGRRLQVVCDQRCTPSYVPHVAWAILFLLRPQPAPWGTYHVTNRGETTWLEFAAEILRQAGMDAPLQPITTAEYGSAAPRPVYSVLDTTKYHRLGGPPMPDWKAALAEYFAEWRTAHTGGRWN